MNLPLALLQFVTKQKLSVEYRGEVSLPFCEVDMTLEEKNAILIEENKRLQSELNHYREMEDRLKEKLRLCNESFEEYEKLKSEMRGLVLSAKREISPIVHDTRKHLMCIRKSAENVRRKIKKREDMP